MTKRDQRNAFDPRNGFDSASRTFHSLQPPINLPPENLPLSAADFSLSLFLRRGDSLSRNSVALIDSATGQRVFFSDLSRRAETLAVNLRSSLELSNGDVAFVLSRNLVQIPILYLALLQIGAVLSPANPISTESEIAALIELSRPKIAFATSETARKLKKTEIERIVVIDSPEFELLSTERKSDSLASDRVKVNQSDVAAIMYSSGTTGRVKGVEITHRNLIAMTAGIHDAFRREQRDSLAQGRSRAPAVMFNAVPYFHMYGLLNFIKSVALGEAVVVMERFEIRKMMRAIEDYRVIYAAIVPPIVVTMAKGRFESEFDLSSLETVACGAAPLGKDVVLEFKAKFPNVTLTQGYGLTESAGVVSRMSNREDTLRHGSSGKLFVNLEAKIVDPETGHALPPGKQGELWVRGDSIMKGYIGDVESTAFAGEGWFKTGDLCYIDDEGYLYVVDRLKELIKVNAYQVAPAELEQLLQSHPNILDAAVIPYPDEKSGQVPLAIVVRRPKSKLSEAQVMDFVAGQVSPYKKIRRVAFVDSIPKSAAGKILRRELRKAFVPSSNLSRL